MVKCIWSAGRKSSHLAWKNLERRFLAKVNGDGRIWMHTLLRNLGQSVACPPNKGLEKWTRISSSSSAKELIATHQGVVNTQGLKLEVMEKESLTLKNTTFLNFVNLKYLILEGVTTSPGKLALPKSLVYLRWTDGSFTYCPIDFSRLEKLVALELVGCRSMKFLPPSVAKARKLIWLELGGCLSLEELPLGLPRFLEHLGLEKTGLKNLPSDLGKLLGLRHLQANQTQLTKLPQGLGRLQMLSTLNLSFTTLTTLPESVGDLKQLKNLDLSETMGTSLPDSIGRLQELKALQLRELKLGSLPESIGGLRSLEDLDLRLSCVKSLPQSLGDLIHLKRLFCSMTPLEILPDSICELHHLLILDLADAQISRLPDAVGELVALDTFRVSSPRLRGLWKTTGGLSNLRLLSVDLGRLCGNPASCLEAGEVEGGGEESALAIRGGQSQMGIHSFLSQLPLLHAVFRLELYGSGVPQYWFQQLFLALQRMPSLKELMLQKFNLVEVIPCELATLTKLTHLSIHSFETLRELTEFLGELTGLKVLELANLPKLGSLPESLSALPSLESLKIGVCPSLQSVPLSFSCVSRLESESSTSQGRNRGRLNSVKVIAITTTYYIPCKAMEKLLKESFVMGQNSFHYFVHVKVAREILAKVGFFEDDSGQQDASRHCSSTSSCRCRFPIHSSFSIHSSWIYCVKGRCDVHRRLGGLSNVTYVKVSRGQQESDGTEDQNGAVDLHANDDEGTEEEEDEALLIKYLGGLWACLLCSR